MLRTRAVGSIFPSMYINRLSVDRQVSVPVEILDALGLKGGDPIVFAIDAFGEVTLGRADDPFINPTANFTGWASEADRDAFADL